MMNYYSSGQPSTSNIIAVADRVLASAGRLVHPHKVSEPVPTPSQSQVDAYRQLREGIERKQASERTVEDSAGFPSTSM